MKNANDLALEGYSISDLVKIVNDYEQLKSLTDEQEETIAELRAENTKLENERDTLLNKVDELKDRLSGEDNADTDWWRTDRSWCRRVQRVRYRQSN